jgi:hypothetical protein
MALMIEAVHTSEMSVYFNKTTLTISQKAVIFTIATVKTCNLAYYYQFSHGHDCSAVASA